MRPSHASGIVKHRCVQEVFGFKNLSPKRARVSIKALGLVHKNCIISMTGRCQTQAASLFRQSYCLPINRMTTFMLSRVPP